jgi:hypothetical protein
MFHVWLLASELWPYPKLNASTVRTNKEISQVNIWILNALEKLEHGSFLKHSYHHQSDKQWIWIIKMYRSGRKRCSDNKSSTSKTVEVATKHGTIQSKKQLSQYWFNERDITVQWITLFVWAVLLREEKLGSQSPSLSRFHSHEKRDQQTGRSIVNSIGKTAGVVHSFKAFWKGKKEGIDPTFHY